MNLKQLLVFGALMVFGCGNQDLSQNANGEAGDDEFVTGNNQSELTSGLSDYYHCFKSGNCESPALSNSTTCLKDRDYDNAIDEVGSDVVVLSLHGGSIEPGSSELTQAIADRFGWSRYDFSAHGSTSCLRGMSNFERLHITAPLFDDPKALSLVGRHKTAVAIHGYDDSRGNYRGAICVGGSGSDRVKRFIASMNANKSKFSQYTLKAVNAAAGLSSTGADCSGLTGTTSSNPVNHGSDKLGGLQLEMSNGIKEDLLNSSSKFNALRSVFYGALSAALED